MKFPEMRYLYFDFEVISFLLTMLTVCIVLAVFNKIVCFVEVSFASNEYHTEFFCLQIRVKLYLGATMVWAKLVQIKRDSPITEM